MELKEERLTEVALHLLLVAVVLALEELPWNQDLEVLRLQEDLLVDRLVL